MAAAHSTGILHHLYVTYNYNPQTMINMRDRVFHALFVKGSLLYDCILPKRGRTILEFGLLIFALLSFSTLVFVHTAFIRNPIRCLDHVGTDWPHDGVLRVELLRHPVDLREEYTLDKSYAKELALQAYMQGGAAAVAQAAATANNPQTAKEIEWLSYNSDNSEHQNVGMAPLDSVLMSNMRMWRNVSSFSVGVQPRFLSFENLTQLESSEQFKELRRRLNREVWPSEEYIVEYSLDYGLLRLSPATRQRLNISVKLVTLKAYQNKCLGDGASRLLMEMFLGYNDVLMGSLKSLAEKEDNKGYVRNVVTGEHFRFVSMWTTRTSYVTALLIMIVFTLSISMLMRYTHHQIFVLIVELLHLLEFNSPRSFRTAPIFTVILALVGMEAIMSEFFSDSTTAFGVIFVVWVADHFDAVCSHTTTTKRHWLKFFFLYHFAFYAYDYRFNGQYSGLALFTSFLFILHSMMFFFHRFELPDVLRQSTNATPVTVSSSHPTMQPVTTVTDRTSSRSEHTITSRGNSVTIRTSNGSADNATITVVARLSFAATPQSDTPPSSDQTTPYSTNTPDGRDDHNRHHHVSTTTTTPRIEVNGTSVNRDRKMSTSTDEGNGSCCVSDSEDVTSFPVSPASDVITPPPSSQQQQHLP